VREGAEVALIPPVSGGAFYPEHRSELVAACSAKERRR
jgi:hypothetical protein